MGADAVRLDLTSLAGEADDRRAARHPSLAALVARLRQRNGAYVLTAVSHGARDAGTKQLLQMLGDLGVHERPRSAPSALDHVGLNLVQLEARGAGTPARALPSALLVAGGAPPQALLLPAVQKVREAAARLAPQARYTLFASEGTPLRAKVGGGSSSGQGGWIEIESMSSP
jgi:hypothetical protein